ncbi:hypothetical protein ELZ88_24060 (plasmid) [Salmonella enterica subsp. enterica serovar Karamoja]|uniref:Uncharacterized protein n=1 Tax=Salmonella enterica subsp. enterica serovar Karamoja TaxID=2500153 RepID=A0A3Q9MU43_SALET|nr:hypothetical protein ELZ88_24060 [Salmonella enterica subsp. enterica serovar Karamoja]AZT44290.1 hypothetical protein EL007_23785 [Salmonella enterica subsp. enterica serovar Karamoja]
MIRAGAARKYSRSGSSNALLHRRPLRTVRASFPAYGSSLSKPACANRFHYVNTFRVDKFMTHRM